MKIRIAIASSNTPADLDGLHDLVDGLEKRRFDTLWLSDTPMTDAIEPLMALAIASSRTTRLKVGTNVVVPGRNPLLMAKELAHLDRLTNGRLLLAFMPGIGSQIERGALGVMGVDRNKRLKHVIEMCRAWWAGEAVTDEYAGFSYDAVKVGPPPVQEPLEIWLGGNGPKGLELTGTHADGWLASRATPAEASASRATIESVAERVGRTIDDDHFGISIPYARDPLPDAVIAAVMRKTDADRKDILPFGADELTTLIGSHIDAGITKFVLRPMTLDDGWDAELDFLAEHTLPLQN
ncbi:MAG: putative F420-dependent oxidoreductase [Candidatus Poriferisodalaceae bacterium]|jgi:probable F420-dependent oxidoreductase